MNKEKQNKVTVKITKTKHDNFDFYIYLNDKPIAVSVDSWAKREDCERIISDVMLCVDCGKSLADWKQAEAEHTKDNL